MKNINNRFSKTMLEQMGLLPYQVEWLVRPDRFKIALWSRQTGKDFTGAAEAVIDCHVRDGTRWLIVGASERQALESLAKARAWAERLETFQFGHYGRLTDVAFSASASHLSFSNGSRIDALPGRAETVRGFSANVILTEFAFHDDQEALWHAVFPMVTNPLQGGEKRLRILTTPNGQGTFFHRLWRDWIFFKQVLTIHEAKNGGLPVDLDILRSGIGGAAAWAQEYECEFMDPSSVLLPFELIAACESAEAAETSTPETLSALRGELFAGIDFGRKHELTVCWILERLEGVLWTREVLVLEKMPTPDQLAWLGPRARLCRQVCLDSTGPGLGLGDLLVRDFSPRKIECCHFTASLKQELFPRLRSAFERGIVRIPPSRAIREDLHGVQRIVSSQGAIGYRAESSEDGHSDRCTALALALRAAETTPPSIQAVSVGRGLRAR